MMPTLPLPCRPLHPLAAALALVAGALGLPAAEVNLALVASPSTSYVSPHETLAALNDGFTPAHSDDKRHGAYGNWPRTGTQWVQYDWSQPIATRRVEVYWFDDRRGVRLPRACRLLYWNGTEFVPVPGAEGLGLQANQFNVTTFPEIKTTRLRLEMEGQERFSTGLLEWRVLDSGNSPNFPPRVTAGPDRIVVLPGRTYLDGVARDDGKVLPAPTVRWSKISGPGRVTLEAAAQAATTARFSAPGQYVLQFSAHDGAAEGADTLRIWAEPPPPARALEWLPPQRYQITSPFWRPRLKALTLNWLPHCIAKIEDPATREGGLENFVQAAHKLAGKTGARHLGPVFANAWVFNTLESICLALMVEPGDDADWRAGQARLQQTLEKWIPILLAAQEPDGYLHTQYTIENRPRWRNKHDHEGYVAGYFIAAALAHHRLTEGRDTRLYDAAKKLADCWVRHIGPPPKRPWYEGHQELEQTLARLAWYVDFVEGPGKGRPYFELAKYLLDARNGGEEYDQSHLPVTRQYEAVGHAVRAAYSYSAMADVALATHDPDYLSAVQSLWHNLVHCKYYVTGGIGSGETSEGFGKNYSLPNASYCESCAGCGMVFFQHKMQRLWHQARYADLYEETLYNAVLGSVDLEAQNFTYTNPLDSSAPRYKWHACPCCVGNIPRTLLMLPTWMYTLGQDAVYVNLYAGSVVTLPHVAGAPLRLEQTTEYPWQGRVTLTVQPAARRTFSLHLRVPNRQTSLLYTNTPACAEVLSVALNGRPVKAAVRDGYVTLKRAWQPGDRVELELPLPVQRIKADDRITANRGRVALRRGPLIYNVESVDQNLESHLPPTTPLSTEWRPDLLGGVVIIKGVWANGAPLLAIPNYARLNRGGRSMVWMKDQ
ncbi:MAG: glycoside hydrolase family 127 protein [Verrucomicrobiae bacterium]|nr:glycoside hydrolase family 127 protein [Verrucomicrobiae bacterium]